MVPLLALFVGVAMLAMVLGLWWWGLLVPGWLLMRVLTRTDDRAFRVVGLWARTRLLNRVRMLPVRGSRFWGASSYALTDSKRSWKAEDLRWGG